ncbi:MAG: ABC transporter ATP-binding protein [Anaerolineales bacterium]|nr:ABC transporter ATP-binding protein [Anaerolineales bacterium]MDW8162734.1 ABC transporter ATP-binding protein [Anaerolineales bacterium]
MSAYFEIKDLLVGFRTFEETRPVLNIERLAIERGETYGLVGESGAGKTVLALTILGLLPKPAGVIQRGEIWFDGEDLLKKSESELASLYRGKRLAMIFQDPMSTLNPVFTVGQQIERVIEYHQGLRGHSRTQKAVELLEMVKLADAKNILKKYPHELSGGQRQRVVIAIALSCGAEFLIADEPTRNLDVTIQAGILQLIDELRKNLRITVLFIANNVSLVNVFCKRVGILYRGKLVEEGPSPLVIREPLHPYTQTLISALPRDRSERPRFSGFELKPEAPQGCPFYSRCPIGVEFCVQQQPRLEAVIRPEHKAACFLARSR